MDLEEGINTLLFAIYSFLMMVLVTIRRYDLLVLVGFFSLIVYLLLRRQIDNAFKTIIPRWNREFVVVYFRKAATKKPLIYYVRPDSKTSFGTIEKGSYDLSKDHALPDIQMFKRRLHFLVDEGNSIPIKTELIEIDNKNIMFSHRGKVFFEKGISSKEKPNEIVCPECHKTVTINKPVFRTWAFRVKSALTTQAYDFIYGEKRQWAFIIAIAAAAIAIIVAIYAITEIQAIKPLVQVIYERTIVGNETMVIKPR